MVTVKRVFVDDPLFCNDPSLAQQHLKDEVDINKIIERVNNGGSLERVNAAALKFGDATSVPDFHESMNFIAKANELFMSLDARVRERFGNDPGKLLAFMQDGRNRAEAVSLGLVVDPVAVPPVVVPPVVLPADGAPGSMADLRSRLAALESDVKADRGDTIR